MSKRSRTRAFTTSVRLNALLRIKKITCLLDRLNYIVGSSNNVYNNIDSFLTPVESVRFIYHLFGGDIEASKKYTSAKASGELDVNPPPYCRKCINGVEEDLPMVSDYSLVWRTERLHYCINSVRIYESILRSVKARGNEMIKWWQPLKYQVWYGMHEPGGEWKNVKRFLGWFFANRDVLDNELSGNKGDIEAGIVAGHRQLVRERLSIVQALHDHFFYS